MLSTQGVRRLLAAFDLGTGRLSPAPVARGVLGEVWLLETSTGSWAVKVATSDGVDPHNPDGVDLQEAAVGAGVLSPSIRRTVDGAVVAVVDDVPLRVQSWLDGAAPSTDLDAAVVGRTVAELHRAAAPLPIRSPTVHPWYGDPVGAAAWDDVVARLAARRAPFGPRLARLREDLVGLESSYLPVSAWGPLAVCHRDLYADNVRLDPDGRLVVYDFDNAGPADPAQELAMVLVEFATGPDGAADPARAVELVASYTASGGPGRLRRAGDFTMAGATLGHILQMWCEQWLAAADDDRRARAEMGVRELLDRPPRSAVVDDLLRAVL